MLEYRQNTHKIKSLKEGEMKKFLLGLTGFALIMGFMVIGCAKGGASPSSVTKQLYAALEKGDAKAVGELMTPEAAQTYGHVYGKSKRYGCR
jgi:uncharacterized membrane protein YvbJ